MMKQKRAFYVFLIGLVVGVSGLNNRLHGDELDAVDLQKKIYATVNKVLPAVVAVRDQGRTFSAVIVTPEGHIITAGHAVRPNGNYTVILSDGREARARGLGANQRIDCAMLKISKRGPWPFAEMGHSSVLVQNQPCISISHPGKFNARRGPVVRLGHIVEPVTENKGMILSTAKMEPGDSGGPLFDIDGKVIGIHSNIRQSPDENYDVPIDSFRVNWDELNRPRKLEIVGLPNLPRLGFRGDEDRSSGGVVVLGVEKDSAANRAGLHVDDILIELHGQRVRTLAQVKSRLIRLRARNISKITARITRNGLEQALNFVIPNEHPMPLGYPELKNLSTLFGTLESTLDDDVFIIHSIVSDQSKRVRATRIRHAKPGNLISKSSRVGDHPEIELSDGSRIDANVVGRDESNDLVLLQARLPGSGGVDFLAPTNNASIRLGRLLLTPDPRGDGDVSVWGSKYFSVPRSRASVKNLGVVFGYHDEEITFVRVRSGGARRAGIRSGDVLIRLNDHQVSQREDVNKFLRQQNPGGTISVAIRRGNLEWIKSITLSPPSRTPRHVADQFQGGKSVRRDGFDQTICHDADIKPSECGGPVFDMQGGFMGINISRYSRTQCYIIPKSILDKFVDAMQP